MIAYDIEKKDIIFENGTLKEDNNIYNIVFSQFQQDGIINNEYNLPNNKLRGTVMDTYRSFIAGIDIWFFTEQSRNSQFLQTQIRETIISFYEKFDYSPIVEVKRFGNQLNIKVEFDNLRTLQFSIGV